MENLIFNSDRQLNTSNFIRIGDLLYFEGPLLTLFQDLKNGHLFIFDWVDRDHEFNRWIIYRVSAKYLLQFIDGNLSHLELFENRPNKTIYFLDIDSINNPFSHYKALQINGLPENYIPNSEHFFDQSDCNSFEKIKSISLELLSKQKSENEYSKIDDGGIFKYKHIKPFYRNKILNSSAKISFTAIKSTELLSEMINLTPNTIENNGLNIFVSFQKLESRKRKEYANEYH